MNVNNRKLFANRDARRRLAEMGGIVNAFPEMMGVAQQFNNGGQAQASQPYTYQDWQNMSRAERAAAGLPTSVIGGQMYFNRFARGMGLASDTGNVEVLPEALPPFLRESEDTRTVVPVQETGGLAPEALDNARMITVGPVPYLVDPATGQGFRMDGMPVSDAEQLRISEVVGSPEFNATQQIMADTRVPVPQRELATALQELEDITARPSRGERDDARVAEARAAAEAAEARVASPTESPVMRPEPLPTIPEDEPGADEGTTRPVLRPDRPAPETEPDAEDTEENVVSATQNAINDNPDDPSGAAAKTALNRLAGGAADTVEGRVAQYEELFQRMFGESDEAKSRERYMNLAMIGFAIAAGEDPSALKNIASGLLQGTAQMREDAAVRRQREDRIKELAVAAGLEDERLAQRLAAKGLAGSDTRDARNAVDFWQDRYNTTMAAVENGTISVPEGTTPEAFAASRADAALSAARTRFPTYATDSLLSGTTGGSQETDSPSVLEQARIALAANPDARQEIVRRLEGLGIDPGDL